MLSEQEKREMLEMARSATVREEFRQLKAASQIPAGQSVDMDHLLDFLTAMSRLSTQPAPPRPFVEYTNVRL